MVKKFKEMLETYAREVNFPYEPIGSEDMMFCFIRHFRFRSEPFDEVIFEHSIQILNFDKANPYAFSAVAAEFPEKPDEKLMSDIKRLMESEYSINADYDYESGCLLVIGRVGLNEFSIEEMMDRGIDDLFIRRIYYFTRLVLQTYANAVKDGTDAKTALAEAEEEIYEVDTENDIEFLYDSVKDIDANQGERHFIEREILLGAFYSNPEYFLKSCSKKQVKLLNEHIEDIRQKLDFRISRTIPYQEYKVRVKKKDKYIHMRLPEAERSGDCTDIFVSGRSGGSPVLATVEYNCDFGKDKGRYIVCIRSKDDCCMVAGVFRKHGKAVDFMKERLSAA